MKFLETLHSSPHEFFPDISDDYIHKYAREVFDIEIKDISRVKDLINMYSHIINGSNAKNAYKISAKLEEIVPYYNLELIYPKDADVLNAVLSLIIKLQTVATFITKDLRFANILDTQTDRVIKEMLNLNLVETVSRVSHLKMESYGQVIKVPYLYRVFADFQQKTALKKYFIETEEEDKIHTGYLYIDYSVSMYAKSDVFNILKASIDFKGIKELKLYVYSVTAFGVSLAGIATNEEEFQEIVYAGALFTPGLIDYTKVIDHSNQHAHLSTFITDSDDFDVALFKERTKKFNLIIINGRGRIIKT